MAGLGNAEGMAWAGIDHVILITSEMSAEVLILTSYSMLTTKVIFGYHVRCFWLRAQVHKRLSSSQEYLSQNTYQVAIFACAR
ncbi:uncharacterized protein Bfra_009655 [Botrytis fragariae]|uniref:Uncharacterized protein n=1 Tax=Botrytis fragariae TaxID=1964551 RepID=A0A8H6EFF7_9HELO|nr:uncharacterized protein Bfra_009655 [Botrytis fragariae]KAF5870272.1 hypothetical protein Bfra_009655 [Botrytis fragariae]